MTVLPPHWRKYAAWGCAKAYLCRATFAPNDPLDISWIYYNTFFESVQTELRIKIKLKRDKYLSLGVSQKDQLVEPGQHLIIQN
jgi:hypothetical protein